MGGGAWDGWGGLAGASGGPRSQEGGADRTSSEPAQDAPASAPGQAPIHPTHLDPKCPACHNPPVLIGRTVVNPLFDRMIRAAKLDSMLYEEVEHDQDAMGQAMAVVVLASVCAGLGSPFGAGIVTIMSNALAALFGWFVSAGVIYLIGTRLFPEPGTEADYGQLLRTIGFASAPGVLHLFGFIPLLGWLIGLVASVWMLAATVVAVRQALDYTSTLRAAGVCVVGWIAMMVLTVVLGGLSCL